MAAEEISVGRLDELADPGCREFQIGDGDWPLRGFIVRQGENVYAYENYCMHVGHPLNWMPDGFLSKDRTAILCAVALQGVFLRFILQKLQRIVKTGRHIALFAANVVVRVHVNRSGPILGRTDFDQ